MILFQEIDIERRPEAVLSGEKAKEDKRRAPMFEIERRTYPRAPLSAEKPEANVKLTGAIS